MEINYAELIYGVRTDIIVVDHNSEMADMSNPSGAIHGDADYIVGETPTGRRFAHDITAITRSNGHTESKISSARLEELAFHLNENKPDLDMTHWKEIDPCYGSEAFITQCTEQKNRLLEIEAAVENGEMPWVEGFNLAMHVTHPL